ncbi:MAG: putative DNA binding domain-containing protein [Paludibacteraceae bacterium]|nr:putative DNA binding domain-containing protein [Paludibacteraceae bacterium]
MNLPKESQVVEYKRKWRDDFLKELCAFANSQGGTLYIGVEDDGSICGIGESEIIRVPSAKQRLSSCTEDRSREDNVQALMENLPNKIHSNLGFYAEVNSHTDDVTGYKFIAIVVEPLDEAISYNGKCYIRSGSTTQELRGQELATFLMHKTKTHWDELPEPRATLADLDYKKIEWFVGMAREKRGVSWEYSEENIPTILTNIEVLREDGLLNNAALLLFGKNPQKWFINSYIKCASFPSTKMVKPLLSHQMYGGNVFELVDKAVEFVSSRIDASVSERTRGAAADIEYELPLQALTEAIVNAIVHRDYMSTASVQVMLFRDRLEVWNPGTLPIGMTIEKLSSKHRSIPVNPKLARAMFFAGYIDELGTGTTDMIDRCLEKGLRRPDFVEDGDFEITLWRPEKTETGHEAGQDTGHEIAEDVLKKLNPRQRAVYELILRTELLTAKTEPLTPESEPLSENNEPLESKSEPLNTEQISIKLGIPYSTTKRLTKQLESMELIKRLKGKRKGFWTTSKANGENQ